MKTKWLRSLLTGFVDVVVLQAFRGWQESGDVAHIFLARVALCYEQLQL